jgi:hypothetical protein
MSAFGGKADIDCDPSECLLMTRSRHEQRGRRPDGQRAMLHRELFRAAAPWHDISSMSIGDDACDSSFTVSGS